GCWCFGSRRLFHFRCLGGFGFGSYRCFHSGLGFNSWSSWFGFDRGFDRSRLLGNGNRLDALGRSGLFGSDFRLRRSLDCYRGVLALGLVEGLDRMLGRLFDVRYRLGQASLNGLLDISHRLGSRDGGLDSGLVDHLCRLVAFAGGYRFGDGDGSSYWHRNFTRSTVALLGGHRLGLVSLGSVAGLAIGRQVLGILLVLGRTATTVVAAALAVARTTLGTITLGGDIPLRLLGGLFYRQFFVLYRWHWLFGLALRAPLLAGGRLDLLGGGGTLLTGLADGGSSGAATATAGSAAFCRLAAGLRGSVRLGDHFAWLALAALGLLAALGGGFVSAATATAAGVTLGAWATVAVVPALTGAIVVAGGLA